MPAKKHIFYGVLNWGLGHATRSIPVIDSLLKNGYNVTLGSDGIALEFLQKTYPQLQSVTLPDLNVRYQKGDNMLMHLLKQRNTFFNWYKKERAFINQLIEQNAFDGIVSDNRPGVHHSALKSVYITHQCTVKAGIFSKPASVLHKILMKPFTEVWVPDDANSPGISGQLGHKNALAKTKYIGLLSTLEPCPAKNSFDVGIILSGPEPQRTILEKIICNQLGNFSGSVLFIRGTSLPAESSFNGTWTVQDVASRQEISQAFADCNLLVARSGYSTLMDLYSLPRPAVLIPTPGQPEQNYLAQLPIHSQNFAVAHQNYLQLLPAIEMAKTKFQDFKPVHAPANLSQFFTLF